MSRDGEDLHRNSKLTPALQKRICEELETGATLDTVAGVVGVRLATLRNWLSDGKAGKSKRHEDFALAVEETRSGVVQRLLKRAHARTTPRDEGGEGVDPLPLLALLDRRYSPQVRVHVANELDALLDRLEVEFAQEPEILERVLRVCASEPGDGAPTHARGGTINLTQINVGALPGGALDELSSTLRRIQAAHDDRGLSSGGADIDTAD